VLLELLINVNYVMLLLFSSSYHYLRLEIFCKK